MRYIAGGVEIQYRECQIMREAAKGFASKDTGYLLLNEAQWLEKMVAETEEHPIKTKLIPPIIQFFSQMDADRKAAVAEYVEYLVEKGRGIEIMVPFMASNRYTVLPVNLHDQSEGKEEREEENWNKN